MRSPLLLETEMHLVFVKLGILIGGISSIIIHIRPIRNSHKFTPPMPTNMKPLPLPLLRMHILPRHPRHLLQRNIIIRTIEMNIIVSIGIKCIHMNMKPILVPLLRMYILPHLLYCILIRTISMISIEAYLIQQIINMFLMSIGRHHGYILIYRHPIIMVHQ